VTPERQQYWMGIYANPELALSNMLSQLKKHPTAFDPMYEWDKMLAAVPFNVVMDETHDLLRVRMSDEHRVNVKIFSNRCYEAAKAGDKIKLEQHGSEFGAMVAEAIREVVEGTKPRKL